MNDPPKLSDHASRLNNSNNDEQDTPSKNDAQTIWISNADEEDSVANGIEKTCNVDNEPPIGDEQGEYWNRPRSNISRVAAALYGFVVLGMTDSSLGVLLPSLESYYHLNYLVVSIAFLAPFCGYIAAAGFCDLLHRRIGRWGVAVLGASCQMICYIISITRPPFPAFVIGYGIFGFGGGLIDSTFNSWLGSLKQANQVMGLLHGFYGMGGIICPAVFTAMIGEGIWWNICYSVLIGMSALSITASALAFWGDTAAKYRERVSDEDSKNHGTPIIEVLKNKVRKEQNLTNEV
jgi:MFS family permease